MTEHKWKGTTFGNGWMHKWLIRLLTVIDVRALYIFTAVCIIPFCLICNSSGRIIYRYFRQHIGYGRLRSAWKTYINHCLFSQVVIDRFAMYAGRTFTFDIEGYSHFRALSTQPEGFVILSSHIGNYELAGYTLTSTEKVFNALVYAGEKETVMQNRNKLFSGKNIHTIIIRQDMSHLFEIDKALQRGEIVSIPSDRINGSPRCVNKYFLGTQADFPIGPFILATIRNLNVLSVNVMKESWTKYRILIRPLEYDKRAKRNEKIDQLSDGYVRQLEQTIRCYPEQWYNFFNFWK